MKKDSVKPSIIIDAAGKSLGRVASEVAIKLRGKDQVGYRPNKLSGVVVEVINIQQAKFTGNKLTGKKYYKFSGYPGGLKESSLRLAWQKNPSRVFRNMVAHMLPKNKLNSRLLVNLIINNKANPV